MERALDLGRLTEALGEHAIASPRRLPTPQELQDHLADAEIRIFLRQPELTEDLIRTGWYLHGVASANAALELYSYPRRRRAFEISAHIFDLALYDETRPRREMLSLAFGAQTGYRRAELDPNATAIFARVAPLLIREPLIEAHAHSLALESGVALLGFETSTLFALYRTWLRQFAAVQRQTGLDDLWGTVFGPPHRVVMGCMALLHFLAFGEDGDLGRAREAFDQVLAGETTGGDLDAQWVAAHLRDFADEAAGASVWRVLPPDIPSVARQAFTLAAPPVLTLWPPQRSLFEPEQGHHPLSEDTRRLVLSVPTSSGKTLIAQFMVVAHLARGGGGVCYVAPLRSLGREVRRALRNRLRVLARELGEELPDFGPLAQVLGDIRGRDVGGAADVSLADLLAGITTTGSVADVEVMTPERLAHLLRRDPEGVLERFRVFIFDEAHFLAEPGRGFTLESILAFLHWRTATTDHKIILLSAALGNEGQIMQWLDPRGEGAAIRSEWRGPRRLHAIFTTRPQWERGTQTAVQSADWPVRISYPLQGVIRLRPAEGAPPRTLEIREPVGTLSLRYDASGRMRRTPTQGPKDSPYSTPQYKMTARMVAVLGAFGSVLVVTSTRRIAQDMASELAGMLDDDPRAIPLADMATQRLGADHPLSAVLRRGVAFHHAALPVDVLEELEEALRDGVLRFMTCTSTLTEGVNLPVRTVVLAETRWDDAQGLLSGARLVNAMGRAGRAGKESEGWIVLVRAAEEKPQDFDLLSPTHEDLEIRSRLATDEALEALAAFEEALRRGEDATFGFAAGVIAGFLSFVWFILASEEGRGVAPELANLDEALGATLVFAQSDEQRRGRWRLVGEAVRRSYREADISRRRRWAYSGTSVATARRLDDLAIALAGQIRDDIDRQGESFAASLSEPAAALALLADADVLNYLLLLPENDRPWVFRRTRASQSAEVLVDPALLVQGWVRGESIPDLGERFLAEVEAQDWRVEQVVDTVAQHLEHFLSWTLGVLVELVNDRLSEDEVEARLCDELPAYVRYGVNSPLALRLVVSGVRSRRLAHAVAAAAVAEGVGGEDLRGWLGALQIAELRQRFSASSSELLDILEFARTPGASVLRDLLEQGRTQISVQLIDSVSAEVDGDTARDAPLVSRTREQAVDLRPVSGEEHPPRLGVFDVDHGGLVALVPTPIYGDVQSILDTGVPTTGLLRNETLELVLVSDSAA